MIAFVIALMSFSGASQALIGYDCGSQSLNVTTLSLLEVGPCKHPTNTVKNTVKWVNLLQINNYVETNVVQCKLEIRRTVYHCGMFSHISIVRNGDSEYILDISESTCTQLYNTGIITIGNNQVISGVKVNKTTIHAIRLAGHVNSEGECSGAGYSDPYGSWGDVVVQGTIRITVQEHTARVDLDNNKIHLRSGTTCVLSDKSCVDSEGGHTFWQQLPADKCKANKYSLLYEGNANRMEDDETNPQEVVYSLSTQDITFALAIKSKESICGETILRTEHPKLIIWEQVRQHTLFLHPAKLTIANLDIFTYVNSKFVYVERHMRGQLKQLYTEVITQRCKLERQTLKNALAIATQAPDQFAYNLMKGPGYMAVTAGEVVHIVKCIPVEVKVKQEDACYAELQVSRRNETFYLTPRTHVLKTRGTRITCNPILPAMYSIDDNWYKIMPKPTETITPTIIKPMIKPTWKYVNPASLAVSGIYTEKDLEQLREHIMFPVERPALLNDVAREMDGHSVQDKEGTIARLLNEDAMDRIVESTWNKVWQKFITFGTASAGIIAVFIIFNFTKILIDIMANGYALHQIYGCSIHLFGALWNSVSYLLIHLNKGTKNHNYMMNRYRQQLQDIDKNNDDGEELERVTVTEPRPISPIRNATKQNSSEPTGFFNIRS